MKIGLFEIVFVCIWVGVGVGLGYIRGYRTFGINRGRYH